MCFRHRVWLGGIAVGAAVVMGLRPMAAQAPALKIVVIAGEDAVNVVQQNTAVAPIVEVRDRNNQPVSGAVVTFAIRSGRATLSGSRTLTVTTNATGRAIASGLTPTGTGALRISASAAFQGQTTAVTIAQTNVMTAAQAAAVSGAGAGTGGAGGGGGTAGGGAAGGTGGGLSTATTLGIVGGAVAGGTVVATNVLGPSGTPYSGTFSGPLVATGPPPFCGFTINMSGTLTIVIEEISASTAQGTAQIVVDRTLHYNAACRLTDPAPSHETYDDWPLAGTQDNLTFRDSQEYTFTSPDGSGQNNRGTRTFTFAGTFDGTQIVGVLTDVETNESITGPRITNSGTAVFPVTLR